MGNKQHSPSPVHLFAPRCLPAAVAPPAAPEPAQATVAASHPTSFLASQVRDPLRKKNKTAGPSKGAKNRGADPATGAKRKEAAARSASHHQIH